eukprot:COSAG04_NODE_298_length_17490_cov_10.214249_9_plen_85_part_00
MPDALRVRLDLCPELFADGQLHVPEPAVRAHNAPRRTSDGFFGLISTHGNGDSDYRGGAAPAAVGSLGHLEAENQEKRLLFPRP